MKWIELAVDTDAEGAEAVAAFLNEFVTGGAAIEQTLAPEPGERPNPAWMFTVRAFFSAEGLEALEDAEQGLWHLAQLRPMSQPRRREMAEEDWAEAWKKDYTVLHIGPRLVVRPSWLDYTPAAGEVVIVLDPGMAFGTGLHPTTRLCLLALQSHVPAEARALDVGTGSGILSIAAALLGARETVALDLDPVAVETARKNAALNRVEPLVRVAHGSLDPQPYRNYFDLICINILAQVIADLAPDLALALAPGGTIIASGILDFQSDDVSEAFQAAGLQVVEKMQDEDWVCLVARRQTPGSLAV